jgi:hypothetical protein
MKITEYKSFESYTARGIASPHGGRLHDCIMQTFAMLRLHPDPRARAFINQMRQTIAAEARRRDNGSYDPWVFELQLPDAFRDDHRFGYLIENISCGRGIMGDVADTLEIIMRHAPLYRPRCIPEAAAACAKRIRCFDTKERLRWQTTVAAPAVARNAFDLGWELRMLMIVRDFEAEVARRHAPGHADMSAFLKAVEASVLTLQQEEEDVNVAAAVALQRAGLDAEVCRMIMPGKTRYMGFALAMMPPYLKLDAAMPQTGRRHTSN